MKFLLSFLFLCCAANLVASPPTEALTPPSWVKIEGQAKLVAAGGDKVFVVGMNDMLYERSFSANSWVASGRKVKDIAVDHNNHLWTIEGNNEIFRYANGKWEKIEGAAKGVAAGGTKVFVIGGDDTLYERDFAKNSWGRTGRTVKDVTIGSDDRVYTLEGKDFYRYDAPEWTKLNGWGQGIAAGGGKLAAIGDNLNLYLWNGSGWVHNPGRTVKSIAVTKQGVVWAIDANDGSIYTYQ